MTKIRVFAVTALACAAAASLSACAGLPLTGNIPADAKAAAANVSAPGGLITGNIQQFTDSVDAFNQKLGKVCGGTADLDWTPPGLPSGSIHAKCALGTMQVQGVSPALAAALAEAGFVPSMSPAPATTQTPAQLVGSK